MLLHERKLGQLFWLRYWWLHDKIMLVITLQVGIAMLSCLLGLINEICTISVKVCVSPCAICYILLKLVTNI